MSELPVTQDLRLRVLAGEDISAEEMLLIVSEIRQGRRAAARVGSTARRKKEDTDRRLSAEDLRNILDQDHL